jgi:hypothetical protein
MNTFGGTIVFKSVVDVFTAIIYLQTFDSVATQTLASRDKVLKHKEDLGGTKRGNPLSPQ